MRGCLLPLPVGGSLAACVLLAALATRPGAAQSPPVPHGQATKEPDWPIDPATYPRPVTPIARATGPITIDGQPGEATWNDAVPITRFVQAQPDVGYPATERTDVRILYDDEAVYLACFCYDSHPNDLTVTSLARDFPVGDNDVLSIVPSIAGGMDLRCICS